MTIEERIENAEKTVEQQRKKLSEYKKDYEEAVINGDPNTLCDVKDKFLGFLFYSRRVEVALLKLHSETSTHRKTLERAEYMSQKRDKEAGKTETVCKYKAEMSVAAEMMMEHIVEMIYREMKAINASAEEYKDALIQRVSVEKGQQFNSRNIST